MKKTYLINGMTITVYKKSFVEADATHYATALAGTDATKKRALHEMYKDYVKSADPTLEELEAALDDLETDDLARTVYFTTRTTDTSLSRLMKNILDKVPYTGLCSAPQFQVTSVRQGGFVKVCQIADIKDKAHFFPHDVSGVPFKKADYNKWKSSWDQRDVLLVCAEYRVYSSVDKDELEKAIG